MSSFTRISQCARCCVRVEHQDRQPTGWEFVVDRQISSAHYQFSALHCERCIYRLNHPDELIVAYKWVGFVILGISLAGIVAGLLYQYAK